MTKIQGWEFAHSLVLSHRSNQMSDCERFAQVAHQKWANEQIARFSEQMAHSLIFFAKNERFAQKTDEQIPRSAQIWPKNI